MGDGGGFEVGDRAFYPVHGVVEVVRIEEKDMGGSTQSFYVLAILGLDRRILVPTANAATVGLRRLVTEEEIDAVKKILADKPAVFNLETWNRRARTFGEKIKTGSVIDIAEIVRELGWLREKKALAFGERRTLDSAMGLLVKEISVSRGEPEATTKLEIDAIFGLPDPLPPA